MFNLSGSEIIFLVLIALVVLGPDKLPEAMRKAGKAYADFKRMTSGFQNEMKSVLDEPMRELRETADLAKKSAMWDLNDPSSSSSNSTNNANKMKPVSGSMAANEPARTTPPPPAPPPAVEPQPAATSDGVIPAADGSPRADDVPAESATPVADAANDGVASA